MKKFEEPIVEVEKLELQDVITTSQGGSTGDNELEEDRD